MGSNLPLLAEELNRGVLDVDVATLSSIMAHTLGHIDAAKKVIVSLQTDQLFRRATMRQAGSAWLKS